jgi:hypothetical protein
LALAIAFTLAPATIAAIATHDTPAGTALARTTLLHGTDVGSGWSSAAPARIVPPLTCPQFDPSVAGAKQIGAAASPTFKASSSGPFVAQDAYAYANAAQRQRVWRAVVRPPLVRCAADGLAGGSGQGVVLAVTARKPLKLPGLPVPAAGYRVSGTASTTGQSLDVFLDMIVLGSGRAITAISVSSIDQPPARRLELRLVGTVVQRLLNQGATLRSK